MSSALRARLRTESESSRAPRLLAGPQSRSSSIEGELGRRGIAKAVVKDERMAIIKPRPAISPMRSSVVNSQG